jgi:hypothetical protein
MVDRLTRAEQLGFAYAFVLHGQLFQPDNRNWFPPDLAKLSDTEIRAKQREIFLRGAENCSGEAELALSRTASPALSASEQAALSRFELACSERFAPPEMKAAQHALDQADSGG